MKFAMYCVKYLLFFFNLLFAVTGIAVLVVGALLEGIYDNYSTFVNENFRFLPIFIIVAGAIIFVISFFGCCGTIKENHCMISTFASLLLIIFIMEIVAAVGVYVFHQDLKEIITSKMESSLKLYDKDADKSWDILQTDLQCCGVNGTFDWNKDIPRSCCHDLAPEDHCKAVDAYETGCMEKMYTFLQKNTFILIMIGVVIGLIQVVGVSFACCLAHSIRRDYETV